jgi:hypothetical protein
MLCCACFLVLFFFFMEPRYILMICVLLKFCLIEGRLEVFQGEKLLSSIPMWTTFGELAILYNCTRTASVKGKRREAAKNHHCI